MSRTTLHFNLFALSLLTGFLLNWHPTEAVAPGGGALPDLASFSQSVQNGQAGVLRGVYVPGILALPVIQQPANQPYYVSTQEGEATQFSIASRYGNIGLLAHNTLSGRYFSRLEMGQRVLLIYGDGREEDFVITQILQFQALQPESVTSTFRNLDKEEVITAGDMFNRAYTGKRHVVFQTCIDAEGNASWGRLFVVAVPVE